MPKRSNWSQLFGWAIFALVIAGGPILNAIQRATGIPIPSYTLPVLIALLMLVNVASSLWRNQRARQAPSGFPDEAGNTQPQNAPMPPFGQGSTGIPRFGTPPSRMPPPAELPPTMVPRVPNTPPAGTTGNVRRPTFEPVISPLLLVCVLVGLLILVAGAFFVFVGP